MWSRGLDHEVSKGRKDSFESLVDYALTEKTSCIVPMSSKGGDDRLRLLEKFPREA